MNLEQRAKKNWPNNPAYQQAWIKMIIWLGDKWLLSNPQPKKETA